MQQMTNFNKRCAEFLGYKVITEKPYDGAITVQEGCNNPSFLHDRMIEESWYVYPEFDSDWNWIMEVVEKIENTNRQSHLDYYEIKICKNCIDVRYSMGIVKRYTFSNDYLEQAISDKRKHFVTKKEATINAINEFLIWYDFPKPT